MKLKSRIILVVTLVALATVALIITSISKPRDPVGISTKKCMYITDEIERMNCAVCLRSGGDIYISLAKDSDNKVVNHAKCMAGSENLWIDVHFPTFWRKLFNIILIVLFIACAVWVTFLVVSLIKYLRKKKGGDKTEITGAKKLLRIDIIVLSTIIASTAILIVVALIW